MIDQHATHQARRNAEKMRAILPSDPFGIHEPDEDFVDERGDCSVGFRSYAM